MAGPILAKTLFSSHLHLPLFRILLFSSSCFTLPKTRLSVPGSRPSRSLVVLLRPVLPGLAFPGIGEFGAAQFVAKMNLSLGRSIFACFADDAYRPLPSHVTGFQSKDQTPSFSYSSLVLTQY
ncbi:hypothetical protein SODALDRAFT_4199 [Sodiomyces alkalinus F11]|uniref:Uncharacterized protein n=1 Tax=Sodiomyces alkalinus (strain CBS 110278 / VKM F-3762 / F11) TaxID=1314773 RepID=A0A3N2Q5A5_SODAK|nr:hypothetical protein SODALDRAFT_4199 [Sodiomyces alkalinus F11]ROT41953.1 hypothetical protein SODALDRAFT_4199 [Sodiomyces alkalinus F11]